MNSPRTLFGNVVIGLGLSLLMSCSGGYGGGGSNPPAALTISVMPATITLGQSATVTWSSNAPCTASGAWSGAKAADGSESVTPAATGTFTYTLTCSGGGYGGSDTESATLMVNPVMIAGLMTGESCCVESEPFQVTGLTNEAGDYRVVLLGSHFVGMSGAELAAYETCDSCLAGQLKADSRAFRLLAITPPSARARIGAADAATQPDNIEFSMPFSQVSNHPNDDVSLDGSYTTNLGTGYTLTLTVDSTHQLAGTDTNGCTVSGKVSARHPNSGLYRVALEVAACDSSNGRYDGDAALIFDSAGRATGMFLSASNDRSAIGWQLSR